MQTESGDLKDAAGKKTFLMGAVREIMQELKTDTTKWKDGVKV